MGIVIDYEKRKKVILKKALDVIIDEGYEDATFQKIADRCGITRTTLYIYFKNKREIKHVILDEADEMLNMGFSESINAILAEVPEGRNMLLFSATMPQEIARITKEYMRDPKEIIIGRKNEGNQNIRHLYYMVHTKDTVSLTMRRASS